MSVLIECLRHGETEGGARYCGSTDVELTTHGWHQMRTATLGQMWDRIITSPMRRCAAFAFELAGRLALPCTQDADWREMHFGEWEGLSAAELLQSDTGALERFWADPLTRAPRGSEPLLQVRSRVLAAFERATPSPGSRSSAAPARTLVVTHGGPIRVLRTVQSSLPLSSLLSFAVPHGAIVTFRAPLVATRPAQTIASSVSLESAEG